MDLSNDDLIRSYELAKKIGNNNFGDCLRAVVNLALSAARSAPVAEINISQVETNEFGFRHFSARLTEAGKELPGGRYLVRRVVE